MRRVLILIIAITTMVSCDLYERVETEVIYTPQIDQEVEIPNWDENETQR